MEELSDDILDDVLNIPVEIDKKVIGLLLCVKNILDHGFFTTYYKPENFRNQLDIIQNWDVKMLTNKFSFVQINSHDGQILKRDEVFDIIRRSGLQDLITACFEIYFIFCKYILTNYDGNHCGTILLNMADKVIACIVCFRRTDVINTEEIEQTTCKFLVELIRNLSEEDEKDFDNQTLYYHLVLQLLLKFVCFPFAQNAILKEVTQMMSRLYSHLINNKEQMKPDQSEICVKLLHIVLEVAKRITMSSQMTISGLKVDIQKLKDILRNIQRFLPFYVQEEIDNCLDTILI